MEKEAIVLNENTLLVRNLNFFTAEIDNDLVMMDEEQGCYFALNSMARNIWELLAEPISYASLLQKLLATYEVDEQQCRKDLSLFLQESLKNDLIHLA